MFVRLLIFFILVVLVYRVARSWLSRSVFQQDGTEQNSLRHADDNMVKDPQCGIYFQQRKGVALTVKGENLYFCSSDCKQRYLAEN